MKKGFGKFTGCGDQVLPDWVAGQHDLLFREVFFHAFIGDTNNFHPFTKQAVGHARVGILLLDQRGYPKRGCHP